MKENYRGAECCYNCKWFMFDSYDWGTYCTLINKFPGHWGTKESRDWAENNHTDEYGVCDNFE